MENNNNAHMEPTKEMIGLSMLEQVKLANESAQQFGDFTKLEAEKVIRKLIPGEKPKVAMGRKAGREKKNHKESLKLQKYIRNLTAKKNEVNMIEFILDKTTTLKLPTTWNPAIGFLNPMGNHFLEESILENNLRKIQGLK